jgi:hypothetical protein
LVRGVNFDGGWADYTVTTYRTLVRRPPDAQDMPRRVPHLPDRAERLDGPDPDRPRSDDRHPGAIGALLVLQEVV